MLKAALLSALNFLESKNRFAAHIVYISLSAGTKAACCLPALCSLTLSKFWFGRSILPCELFCLVAFVLFCFYLKGDLVVNHILSFTSSRVALSCVAFL